MTDFEEYIRQGEPEQKEKSYAWQTAIGLQETDGLKPSSYLIEAAKQNIEGDITIDEVRHLIDNYYKANPAKNEGDRTEEVDTVQSAKVQDNAILKCKNCTLNCTLDEHFVLEFLKTNPQATQKEIATQIKKSERTVKTITGSLQQKNLLERSGGKKMGSWTVKI